MPTSRNVVAALCLGAPLAGVLGCGNAASPDPLPIPRVKTFEVAEAAGLRSRSLSGEVIPADRVPLSFSVGGTVVKVAAEVGEPVQKGQLLAALDREPLRLALQEARSRLASTRARLVEAEQAFARAKTLFAGRGGSRAELDVAQSNLESARAALRGSQSAVDRAERDLRMSRLKAPFDGQVAERSVDAFQEVSRGETVFVVQGGDNLKVRFLLPEILLPSVEYGASTRVTFPTVAEAEVPGTVTLIGAQSEAGNAFPVEVRLEDPPPAIRTGMSARVQLSLPSENGDRPTYRLPLSVLALDHRLRSAPDPEASPDQVPVFVYDPDTQRVQARTIRVADIRGNDLIVYEGVSPGDQVISAGVAFLREGMEVRPWSAERGLTDG